MNDALAASRADEFIKLMIQHQANLFGNYPLDSLDGAKKVALSLATLRVELIAQLKLQP